MIRRVAIISFVALFAYALMAQTSTPPPVASGKSAKTKKSKPEKAVATEFSEEVAKQVLSRIRQGLEAHNPRQVLSTFDREQMDGYLALEDRFYSYFKRYESFRVFYRITESTTEDDRGVALADWQIEATPSSGPARRREGQVRFEFAPGPNGWRIVDFTPRDFFQ
jgi:hypothetical protein